MTILFCLALPNLTIVTSQMVANQVSAMRYTLPIYPINTLAKNFAISYKTTIQKLVRATKRDNIHVKQNTQSNTICLSAAA